MAYRPGMAGGRFSTETFDFLQDLELFNERAWFKANQDRYERHVREPLLELIEALRDPLHQRVSERIVCDPRKVGGSMFRIQRDTRFSSDTSPYKTNAGAILRHDAGRDTTAPGVYVHLEAGNCLVGLGVYHPPTEALRRLRDAMVDDPDAWADARAVVGSRAWSFAGDTLKRAPRGYPPDHPLIEDLRRTSVAVLRPITEKQVCSDRLVATIVDRAAEARPLWRWLCGALDLPV